MGKWASWGVVAVAVVAVVAVAVWTVWPLVHKDIGKETVTATNSVVTTSKQATNEAVNAKATNTAEKINGVVRRSAADAGRVRADPRPDPDAYNAWVAGLCANDIYEGYADCARYRGKSGGKGS